jgi:dimethylhistidine N-methyltransferase
LSQSIQVINPQDFAARFGGREAFALDILVGLSEERKSIPSKYMYDDEGSRLFTKITHLPEYYLTECERDSLERNKEQIADCTDGEPFNLVEFGSGDGVKTRILLKHFMDRGFEFQYVPVDISRSAMEVQLEDLGRRFADLRVQGLVTDYFTALKWLTNRYKRKNFVLFLGSNIGNFTHGRARFFLRHLWNCLHPNDNLLIGFDLKKDIELFLTAYNDSQGLTAEFNLNVLRRINRELGGTFDVSKFRHFGTYDVFTGAMESYLVSLEQQEVFIEAIGRWFTFAPWEPIHMEYSYKYLRSDIDLLANETGYSVRHHLYDAKKYFIDSIWEVQKSDRNGHLTEAESAYVSEQTSSK